MDYKKYSLENLENWLHDAISSGEATPQEIYDVIRGVVHEEYHYFKYHTGRCYELLALLNANCKEHLSCDKDDPSPECKKEWTKFWEDAPYPIHVSEDGDVWIPDSVTKKDKVVKWQLPVEIDGASGEYYIQFPDDLMEAANLKENDMVEWVPQDNGSYLLKKVNG